MELYKAKTEADEWVFGYLDDTKSIIINPETKERTSILTYSICKATNLKDRLSLTIYENDIVMIDYSFYKVAIESDRPVLQYKGFNSIIDPTILNPKDIELVGNVFDDISLLDKGIEAFFAS